MHENAEAISRRVCDEAPCRYCERRDIQEVEWIKRETKCVRDNGTHAFVACLPNYLLSFKRALKPTLKKGNDRIRKYVSLSSCWKSRQENLPATT